jgi:hypothetical protein
MDSGLVGYGALFSGKRLAETCSLCVNNDGVTESSETLVTTYKTSQRHNQEVLKI